jgi:hypothetical protein
MPVPLQRAAEFARVDFFVDFGHGEILNGVHSEGRQWLRLRKGFESADKRR